MLGYYHRVTYSIYTIPFTASMYNIGYGGKVSSNYKCILPSCNTSLQTKRYEQNILELFI